MFWSRKYTLYASWDMLTLMCWFNFSLFHVWNKKKNKSIKKKKEKKNKSIRKKKGKKKGKGKITGHLLALLSSKTPFSASSKNILALLIWLFMKFLHLSVTLPANMSSSESPACASSSCGRYILPLLALYTPTKHFFSHITSHLASFHSSLRKQNKNDNSCYLTNIR